MGQEIRTTAFQDADYRRFQRCLHAETELLGKFIQNRLCSEAPPVAGFEIEAWLTYDDMRPAPLNEAYLLSFNHPMAGPELAKFNVEMNTPAIVLTGDAFGRLHGNLGTSWENAARHARQMDLNQLMIGILPTLRQQELNLDNMSNLNRYRQLNLRVLEARNKPIVLDICGHEHLRVEHHDVMLEAATTSFQLHIQVPLSIAHHFYNASIVASAPMVALCANAPYLFGRDLWAETRIPMFEQAVALGGYQGAAEGPLHRVSFGSDYARHSILECFQENARHFPVLLPESFDDVPEMFSHLRLHNGTIWRWNRPLVGFDPDGTPHIRIEHRTPAAGPTVLDTIANAAFFYGLIKNLCDDYSAGHGDLGFAQAKDNFYQAARHGLDSHITWLGERKSRLLPLIEYELIPRAEQGLQSLGIEASDSRTYLDIIRRRIATQQTGSQWQRRFIKAYPGKFFELTKRYMEQQRKGEAVAGWDLD
ncbi:MAG: glutamate--cysteine ligase [Methylomonas sp.]|nr:glutamate--cysteine ligase [Methylomonas sp.]